MRKDQVAGYYVLLCALLGDSTDKEYNLSNISDEFVEGMKALIQTMPKLEQDIINKRFIERKSLKACIEYISSNYPGYDDLTEPAMRQLETRVVRRLRPNLSGELGERIVSAAKNCGMANARVYESKMQQFNRILSEETELFGDNPISQYFLNDKMVGLLNKDGIVTISDLINHTKDESHFANEEERHSYLKALYIMTKVADGLKPVDKEKDNKSIQ